MRASRALLYDPFAADLSVSLVIPVETCRVLMPKCYAVFVLLFSVAAPVAAQTATPDSSLPLTPGLVRPGLWELAALRAHSDSISADHTPTPSTSEVLSRVGAGALGAGLGALGGGALGYAMLPRSDCHCDDPGLHEFLVGATVGSVAGAALAAALPAQRSRCSYGRRALYGLLGGMAGGALGFIASSDHQRVVFVPLGAGVGSGVLGAFC